MRVHMQLTWSCAGRAKLARCVSRSVAGCKVSRLCRSGQVHAEQRVLLQALQPSLPQPSGSTRLRPGRWRSRPSQCCKHTLPRCRPASVDMGRSWTEGVRPGSCSRGLGPWSSEASPGGCRVTTDCLSLARALLSTAVPGLSSVCPLTGHARTQNLSTQWLWAKVGIIHSMCLRGARWCSTHQCAKQLHKAVAWWPKRSQYCSDTHRAETRLHTALPLPGPQSGRGMPLAQGSTQDRRGGGCVSVTQRRCGRKCPAAAPVTRGWLPGSPSATT